MKPFIFNCYLLIALIACSDSEITTTTPHNIVTIDKQTESFAYKLSPSDTDQLTISFLNNQERDLKSLTLMKGDLKLETVDFVRAPFGSSAFSADIKYSFKDGESYDFLLETNDVRDTVFLYHLMNYKHIFVNKFDYQKIDDWTQMVEYDIDPNRKFILVTDYINNQFIFKRISLEDNTIITFPGNFSSAPIRAISDNELISYSFFYNDHYLKGDSAALLKYNLSTGATQFLDWISAYYGVLGRVVNNHIAFYNPVFTSKTTTLIDLADQTRTVLPNSDINTINLRSETFDNLYNGNTIFDWNSNTFVKNIDIPDSAFISYIDNIEQYSLVIETIMDVNNSNYYSRLLVYKGTNLFHKGILEQNCYISLGKIIRAVKNKIVFYKSYGFSHNPTISGYYSFDLGTGVSSLVQCDSDDLAIRDFALSDNTLLSVRSNGLYKITIN